MPIFSYTALTPDGSLIKGEGEFNSLEELYYFLQSQGNILVDYSLKRALLSLKFPTRYKRKDLADFLHQLSFMIKSGLPLITALEDLEKETPKLRKIIAYLKREISRGESFTEAIKKTKTFPPIVVSLIQIGEATGTLDKTLEDASQHLYRVEEIISNTKRALIYPIFIFTAMSFALGFWIFYALPQIFKVFKEMNIKLPLSTIILMQIIDFLMKIKFIIPLTFITLILLFIVFYKHPRTQILADKLLLKIPILGRIRRLNFLAIFFEYFALMLDAGLDLLRIFNIKKTSFHRLYHKSIVEKIEQGVLQGETIVFGMRKENIFSSLDIRMVNVGESTGRLSNQMKMLANFYFTEVKNLIDTLTKLLEPVILVFAGIIFLIILLALVGPVYELISQIGKTY